MALAGRSVQVALAANAHLAFDTELLRTHTAWQGAPAALPAQRRGLERWLVNTPDATLWGNPPVLPWRVTELIEKRIVDVSFRHRFRGISTKGGVSFLYELAPRDSQLILIHESPRLDHIDGAVVIIRRFEISASEEMLELLAQAEVGRVLDLPKSPAAVLIQRERDFLLVAARGRPVLTWQTSVAPEDYAVEQISDDAAEPRIIEHQVAREEVRTHLIVPPHGGEIAFELCTAVVKTREEAERLVPKLVPIRVAPAQLDFITGVEKETNAPALKLIETGKFAGAPLNGDESYIRERLQLPAQIEPPITGMEFLPNGDLTVCTRNGEVWIVQLSQTNAAAVTCRRFARGLHAPSGLKFINGQLHVLQQCELTRLVDTDANGEADFYECVSQSWGFIGHPAHGNAGPTLNKEGALVWALGGLRGLWDVQFMGWAVRSAASGNDFEGFARGLRAPGGLASFGADRDVFATDNRGAWAGACKLVHLQDDRVFGFPSATPAPEDEFKAPKQFDAPAVWLPQSLAKSAGGVVAVENERFGPWKGQLLVADPLNSAVLRVALEKVNGEWQGAVWPLLGGVNARCLVFGGDSRLYVAGDGFIERIEFSGKIPFEVKEIHAATDGLELMFTEPVDASSAARVGNYAVGQFAYVPGTAEEPLTVDQQARPGKVTTLKVAKASVENGGRTVRLIVEGLRTGYVTTVQAAGVRAADGRKLAHDTTHFTLNQIPR